MELNGVANMLMLIQVHKQIHSDLAPETLVLFEKLEDQLDLLNRYMTAIGDLLEPEHEELIPLWHELRDNRKKYKNNRGE